MNTDIRIKTSFFRHPKTLKLIKSLGLEAPIYLQKLWIFAAENKPSGRLTGMTWTDICAAMEYKGSPQKIIGALLRIGYLDRPEPDLLAIHDWADHNCYASNAESRRSAAKQGATSRWQSKNNQRLAGCGSEKGHMPVPSPSPSPSPVPAPAKNEGQHRADRIWKDGIEYSTSRDAAGRLLKILK
jgi:hypothetical protein